VLAKLEPALEFFAQRKAEQTVRAYLPRQEASIRAHVEAADQRVRAARRAVEPVAACVLLHDAVRHYLRATQWARSGASDASANSRPPDEQSLPTLGPDPLQPGASPSDDERVRGALAATDSLFFDSLPTADAVRTRTALDRAASALRRRLEPRSLTNVRATRWGRVAALVLVAGYTAFACIHAVVAPKNLALGKPVHASSIRGGRSPDGHEIVDGEIGTSYGLATNTEDSPNVVIDLAGLFRIESVKVYNRVDEAFDDCLPLVVELSIDGVKYTELARRDQHFGTDPPWSAPGNRQLARYVRLRVARKSYLALSEVEVYGKKP
jgi:hypothetical protein